MSELATFQVLVDWDADGNYTGPYDDITDDVDSGSFVIGIDDPAKRVANVGTLFLRVDNSERKYTPKYAGGPLYLKLLPGRLIRVRAVVNGTAYTLFSGTIVTIDPGSQRYGERYATIECRDRVADYRDYDQLDLPVRQNARADELLASIDSRVFEDAPPRDYDIGRVSFEYAGDTWTPGETNALTAIEDVVNSEFGYWWVARNGTVTFKHKDWFLIQTSVDAAQMLNEQQSRLVGRLSLDDVSNVVSVTYTPRRYVSGNQVIARASSVITVPSGTNTVTLKLKASDAGSGEMAGIITSILPVAGTDYTVNDQEGGGGFDYTDKGRVTISKEMTSTTVILTFSNSASGVLYVRDLQVRGTLILKSSALQVTRQNSLSVGRYGKRTPLSYTLPFVSIESSYNLANAIVSYLLDRYAHPEYTIERIEIDNPEWESEDLNPFALQIGDVIQISEYQTATNNQKYMIRSLEGDFEKGELSRLVFGLIDLDRRKFLILDHPVNGRLDTGRLGI